MTCQKHGHQEAWLIEERKKIQISSLKATHILQKSWELRFYNPSPLFFSFHLQTGYPFSTKLSECIDFFQRVRCTKILRIGGPVKSKRQTPSFCACVRTRLRYATFDLRCVLHMLCMYVATFHCPNAILDQWRGGGEKHLKLNWKTCFNFPMTNVTYLSINVLMHRKKILHFFIQRALLSIPL